MKLFSKEKIFDKRIIRIGRFTFVYHKLPKKSKIANQSATDKVKLATLKGSANNKRCFLLATGASIIDQDLTKLENEDCYSISNFFLHPHIQKIKPKLHFFAPFHEPLIRENFIDWLKMADQLLPAETNMVIEESDRQMVESNHIFSNRQVFYVKFKHDSIVNIDIQYPIISPETGPIMMLPVLAYMGYQEINLIGMDMNRLSHYKDHNSYFYQTKDEPRTTTTEGAEWLDILPELERTYRTFQQFKIYQDYFFEHGGPRIYNLSPISWLTFIEKKSLNDML